MRQTRKVVPGCVHWMPPQTRACHAFGPGFRRDVLDRASAAVGGGSRSTRRRHHRAPCPPIRALAQHAAAARGRACPGGHFHYEGWWRGRRAAAGGARALAAYRCRAASATGAAGAPACHAARCAWRRRWWRWCVSTRSACVLPGSHRLASVLGQGGGLVPGSSSHLCARACCWPSFAQGDNKQGERQVRGASRGGWSGARCMPRGRGRRPRAVARSRACEDSTRTPRGRAKAQNVHSRAWAAIRDLLRTT